MKSLHLIHYSIEYLFYDEMQSSENVKLQQVPTCWKNVRCTRIKARQTNLILLTQKRQRRRPAKPDIPAIIAILTARKMNNW